MKTILFFAFTILSFNLTGQINTTLTGELSGIEIGKRIVYSESDTVPFVVHLKAEKEETNALYYLNEEIVDGQIVSAINPNQIEEVRVEKRSNELKELDYDGIIYIRTKEAYTPSLISLNDLKVKYLNLSNDAPTLFLLNDKIVNDDYDTFKVDEKYILKIEVQEINNPKEGLDINVIRLITRTKENVKKANTIRIKRK